MNTFHNSLPNGLDSKLFLSNFSMQDDSKESLSNLYSGLIYWSEMSGNLGFLLESDAILNIAEKVLAASHMINVKSESANEICRKVVQSLPENIRTQLNFKIMKGCSSDIYALMLKILHEMKESTPDRFKLSSAISFLDSEKDIRDTLLAHQIINDSYSALEGFMPNLILHHETVVLKLVDSNKKIKNNEPEGLPVIAPLRFPICGKCKFKCIIK